MQMQLLIITHRSDEVNIDESSNKIKTIITQEIGGMQYIGSCRESWSDWKLKIPADLPISSVPGTTTPHVPYRLLYPTNSSYNTSNVNGEGSIDAITSKSILDALI